MACQEFSWYNFIFMKRKPPRGKGNKNPGGRWKGNPPRLKPRIPRLVKLPLEILTIVATITSILALIPRLSIHTSGTIRQRDPMGTVFTIYNDGLLPIHDVDAICGIDSVLTAQGGGVSNIGLKMPESHANVLSPSNGMSLPCAHAMNMGENAASAKIAIIVTYRPDWVPWHRRSTFPMQAGKADDGTWVWKALPQ